MRQNFTKAIKAAAFERAKGCCEDCGFPIAPKKPEYDHDNPDGLTGEPTLSNCRVLCRACHRAKTRTDVAKIARAKRRQYRNIGIKKPRTITAWRKFNKSPVYASRER